MLWTTIRGPSILSDSIRRMWEIRFAQSARRHRVGRARALHVLANPHAVVSGPQLGGPAPDPRMLFVGDDASGRALEVVAVIPQPGVLLVIHVLDLRQRNRGFYEGTAR